MDNKSILHKYLDGEINVNSSYTRNELITLFQLNVMDDKDLHLFIMNSSEHKFYKKLRMCFNVLPKRKILLRIMKPTLECISDKNVGILCENIANNGKHLFEQYDDISLHSIIKDSGDNDRFVFKCTLDGKVSYMCMYINLKFCDVRKSFFTEQHNTPRLYLNHYYLCINEETHRTDIFYIDIHITPTSAIVGGFNYDVITHPNVKTYCFKTKQDALYAEDTYIKSKCIFNRIYGTKQEHRTYHL